MKKIITNGLVIILYLTRCRRKLYTLAEWEVVILRINSNVCVRTYISLLYLYIRIYIRFIGESVIMLLWYLSMKSEPATLYFTIFSIIPNIIRPEIMILEIPRAAISVRSGFPVFSVRIIFENKNPCRK